MAGALCLHHLLLTSVATHPLRMIIGLLIILCVHQHLTHAGHRSVSCRFGALLRDLEDRKGELGVTSYGLSSTTLEEVFLNVSAAQGMLTHANLIAWFRCCRGIRTVAWCRGTCILVCVHVCRQQATAPTLCISPVPSFAEQIHHDHHNHQYCRCAKATTCPSTCCRRGA